MKLENKFPTKAAVESALKRRYESRSDDLKRSNIDIDNLNEFAKPSYIRCSTKAVSTWMATGLEIRQ
jgi:hypothetical protein